MPLILIPEVLEQKVSRGGGYKVAGFNLTPLAKTWWHLEWWAVSDRTYRLAKRSDHTNILIKLDIDEFYAHCGPPVI